MSIVKTSTLSNIEGTKELAVNDLIDRACCRAWVNFNGTVNPCVVRRSYNVDSITDIDTGKYTITFANPMPDANYCVQIGNGLNAVSNAVGNTALIVNNSSVTITHFENGIQKDIGFIYVAIFR